MRLVLPIVLVLSIAACANAPRRPAQAAATPAPVPAASGTAQRAIANLASASGTLVSGRVELRPAVGGVRITGVVGGLTRNGAHGLQVHARGDCSAVDARSAGAYFDPGGTGAVGGNADRIVADADGVARVNLLVRDAVLGGGAVNDIAGRALIVLGATTGASSARVACGVIAVQP